MRIGRYERDPDFAFSLSVPRSITRMYLVKGEERQQHEPDNCTDTHF
jgi:hypothetical protein